MGYVANPSNHPTSAADTAGGSGELVFEFIQVLIAALRKRDELIDGVAARFLGLDLVVLSLEIEDGGTEPRDNSVVGHAFIDRSALPSLAARCYSIAGDAIRASYRLRFRRSTSAADAARRTRAVRF